VLYFSHDFLDGGTLQPPVPITGILAGAGSINAEETSETIQPQFSLQNRESLPLEVSTSRYQEIGPERLNARPLTTPINRLCSWPALVSDPNYLLLPSPAAPLADGADLFGRDVQELQELLMLFGRVALELDVETLHVVLGQT
jgi:hypothetical protein